MAVFLTYIQCIPEKAEMLGEKDVTDTQREPERETLPNVPDGRFPVLLQDSVLEIGASRTPTLAGGDSPFGLQTSTGLSFPLPLCQMPSWGCGVSVTPAFCPALLAELWADRQTSGETR